MKKRKIVLAVLLSVLVVSGLVYYFVSQPADKCTSKDRAQGNCVPAGRCTPPGDPREATIDCVVKDYDRKYID